MIYVDASTRPEKYIAFPENAFAEATEFGPACLGGIASRQARPLQKELCPLPHRMLLAQVSHDTG